MLNNFSVSAKLLSVFICIAVLTLCAAGTVVFIVQKLSDSGNAVAQRFLPVVVNAEEFRAEVTLAHLVMEEIAGGDDAEDFSEVVAHLTQTRERLNDLLELEETWDDALSEHVPATVNDLLTRVDDFQATALLRYQLAQNQQGVGSGADEEFDQLYETLVDQAGALAASRTTDAQAQADLGQARHLLSHGHLLIAEILGGDFGEDINEAYGAFDDARAAVLSVAAREFGDDTAFAELEAGITRLIELAELRYSTTIDQIAQIETAEIAFDAAFDAISDRANDLVERVHAETDLAKSELHFLRNIGILSPVLAAFAILAALAFGYFVLRKSVGIRLNQVVGFVDEILAGRLDADSPTWTGQDEVTTLRDAVENMRQAFQRQVELEAEANRMGQDAKAALATAESEAEASRAARAQADAALQEVKGFHAAAEAFRQEFSTVAEAAMQGNFDSRMKTDFGNAEFDRLAASTNKVFDTIATGIDETSRAISELAQGNLNAHMGGDFQGAFARLQADVNETIARLAEIASGISTSSRAVADKSNDLSAGAAQLSERSTEQASTLEETNASMSQIAQGVSANAANAENVAGQVGVASDRARAGEEVVAQAIAAMKDIETSTGRVGEIISVIDDISFQTNLLALNAGVEAARAGESGKGFAVVAQEVRMLAQRASSATRDISELIHQSAQDVGTGAKLVTETGTVLSAILEAIRSVTDATSQITEATKEQKANVRVVSDAMEGLDQMTQRNAAMAEASVRSIDELGALTVQLNKIVGFFKMNAGHSSSQNESGTGASYEDPKASAA